MRAVVQRVTQTWVEVGGTVVGGFDGPGLLVYVGVTHSDTKRDAAWLARKIWELRIMRWEQSAAALAAPILVISQFTLYGNAQKGRRPTWQAAAPGPISQPLYEMFCTELSRLGATVSQGVFGADMAVSATNDGPITLILDSPQSPPS
jgi:D-aminoacyl-tRNA deacylase